VSDKYFTATPNEHPFEHYTARTICRNCLERVECLEDAVGSPGIVNNSPGIIRGGEPWTAVRALRRMHFLGGIPVAELVDQALELQQKMDRTVGDFPSLRQGRFSDAETLA
jgi:hypothetical protein